MVRLFLEQDPPQLAIHSGVVGFIVLIFIVARVLTTRGFAAFKPGFNTRAVATWLACTSLTLLVIYSAMLAYILYKESMAGAYTAPEPINDNASIVDPSPSYFPLNISFLDMSYSQKWDVTNQPQPVAPNALYYVLSLKPLSLYSREDQLFLFALRIVLKFAQCGLLASLLLLNTYWSGHVEALIDEGDFMSRTEVYLFYFLTGFALVFPISTLLGIGYITHDWTKAYKVSDLFLLLPGLGVIIGYTLTCIRLRSLERDSRNVNGDETFTTMQLSYYIYCVYWLIGSMICILILGVLYEFRLVLPEYFPVLAQAVKDFQGALWSTLMIMIYPAAMFLLYPSVDVLTTTENDPSSRFQKRVRRTIMDAKRLRDNMYLGNGSMSGIESGDHSSLHGLTAQSGLVHPLDNGQSQTSQSQRYSYYEPMRRERMGSITAMVNEMQLIREEDDGNGSIEMVQNPTTRKPGQDDTTDAHTNGRSSKEDLRDRSLGDQSRGAGVAEGNNKSSRDRDPRRNSGSPSNFYRDVKDVEVMKKWITQHEELDRAGIISSLEETIRPDQRTWSNNGNDNLLATSITTSAPISDDLTTLVHPNLDHPATHSSTTHPNNNINNDVSPATATAAAAAAAAAAAVITTPKPVAAPLAGILKTRNSTQNPFDHPSGIPSFHRGSMIPPNSPAPAIGVRTSSILGAQQTLAGPRKNNEYSLVKRRISNSSNASAGLNLGASASMPDSTIEPPLLSPTSQQRRSNVTARVDAGALALVAQQQQQQQRISKPRSSLENDYFSIRKSSFESGSTPTTPPPPLPYEPQAQGFQPLELSMSPTMTGFLMADPYPSAGSRVLGDGDGDQDQVSGGTRSNVTEDDSGRKSGSPSSKMYKAPPPPIPTDAVNAKSATFGSGGGTVPTTPTTPLGVRPRRSVDTVVDPQFLEMAKRMYEDHVVPEHIVRTAAMSAAASPALASSTSAGPAQVGMPSATSPPYPFRSGFNLSSVPPPRQQPQPDQTSGSSSTTSQHIASLPTKSPHRIRETFESKVSQGGSGPSLLPGHGVATPPSPASSASPTIASATTLPRPLTPAWYETKNIFASTNDVLNHYNAVMRAGSHHKQQLLQPGGNNQPYFHAGGVGPMDDVPQAARVHNQQLLSPQTPSPRQQHLHLPPQQQEGEQQQQQQQQRKESRRSRETLKTQSRMGSADSFGVIRQRPGSDGGNGSTKDDAGRSTTARQEFQDGSQHQRQQQQQQSASRSGPSHHQLSPAMDRHSFMMPSEPLSTYSTWTGELSDVTNTSGEVSVGAFGDRKQHVLSQELSQQQHHEQQRRKSGEKTDMYPQSSSSHNGASGSSLGDDHDSKDRDVRKSQASAYSMGSSFGASSSSRQSAGAFSEYSNNSGSIILSAALSSVGQPTAGANSSNSGSGSGGTPPGSQKHSSGSFKKRRSNSGSGRVSLTGGSGSFSGSGNSHAQPSPATTVAAATEATTSSPVRTNNMRLSAFGPTEDDIDIPEPSYGRPSQRGSELQLLESTSGLTPNLGSAGREFSRGDTDPRGSQELERKIQQEWMDRRAAVKKDSKNRLEQLHKEQEILDEQRRFLREQQQVPLSSTHGDATLEEPYALNSVYLNSTPEDLEQFGSSSSAANVAYPLLRAESTGKSSVPTTSPGDSIISAPTPSFSATQSWMATSLGATEPPSPSPNSQQLAGTFPHYGSGGASSSTSSRSGASSRNKEREEEGFEFGQGDMDEDANPLIQSSASYALHRKKSLQQQQQPSSALLHYDSIDSIATVRAHQYNPQQQPYQRNPIQSSSSSIQSRSSSPSSPSPMSQRPLYAQFHPQPAGIYTSQQQQQQQQQQPLSPRASITVVGPSQYRIIPDDMTRDAESAASMAALVPSSNASRSLSPINRTSSRLTNLTSGESEYMWESAELSTQRWEMMDSGSRN